MSTTEHSVLQVSEMHSILPLSDDLLSELQGPTTKQVEGSQENVDRKLSASESNDSLVEKFDKTHRSLISEVQTDELRATSFRTAKAFVSAHSSRSAFKLQLNSFALLKSSELEELRNGFKPLVEPNERKLLTDFDPSLSASRQNEATSSSDVQDTVSFKRDLEARSAALGLGDSGVRADWIEERKTLDVSTILTTEVAAENGRSLAGPDAIDWTGFISDVKFQGFNCGGCWAFALTGLIEGHLAIATGGVVSLSEQIVLDCDRARNKGCSGGNYYHSLVQYASESGFGLGSQSPFSFGSAAAECTRWTPISPSAKTQTSTQIIFVDRSEDALENALRLGPVAVALSSYNMAFQYYAGGILDDAAACGTTIDHAALLVGMGADAVTGKKYWLVRNSWGTEWGEQGHIRLARDDPNVMRDSNGLGMCGILSQANTLGAAPPVWVANSNLSAIGPEARQFCTVQYGCSSNSSSSPWSPQQSNPGGFQGLNMGDQTTFALVITVVICASLVILLIVILLYRTYFVPVSSSSTVEDQSCEANEGDSQPPREYLPSTKTSENKSNAKLNWITRILMRVWPFKSTRIDEFADSTSVPDNRNRGSPTKSFEFRMGDDDSPAASSSPSRSRSIFDSPRVTSPFLSSPSSKRLSSPSKKFGGTGGEKHCFSNQDALYSDTFDVETPAPSPTRIQGNESRLNFDEPTNEQLSSPTRVPTHATPIIPSRSSPIRNLFQSPNRNSSFGDGDIEDDDPESSSPNKRHPSINPSSANVSADASSVDKSSSGHIQQKRDGPSGSAPKPRTFDAQVSLVSAVQRSLIEMGFATIATEKFVRETVERETKQFEIDVPFDLLVQRALNRALDLNVVENVHADL